MEEYRKRLRKMKFLRWIFDIGFVLAFLGSTITNVALMGKFMGVIGTLVFAMVIGVIREIIIVKPYNKLCDKINEINEAE